MYSVYLGGPIMGRSDDECIAWRRTAVGLLAPLHSIDPIKGRDYRGDYDDLGVAEHIVEGDLEDIRNSFCLLVFYDQPSVGTAMEIRYARAERNIPVYVIDISKSPRSPWLVYHATRFFERLTDACDYIKLTAPREAAPKDWWLHRYRDAITPQVCNNCGRVFNNGDICLKGGCPMGGDF